MPVIRLGNGCPQRLYSADLQVFRLPTVERGVVRLRQSCHAIQTVCKGLPGGPDVTATATRPAIPVMQDLCIGGLRSLRCGEQGLHQLLSLPG